MTTHPLHFHFEVRTYLSHFQKFWNPKQREMRWVEAGSLRALLLFEIHTTLTGLGSVETGKKKRKEERVVAIAVGHNGYYMLT